MTVRLALFPVEPPLAPQLESVFDYWRGLRRGEATVPFADDIDITAVAARCGDVFLLSVFERPERFRIDLAVTPQAPRISGELLGRFIDEIDLPSPLEFLRAQADTTVESLSPTLYEHQSAGAERSYHRLLLPAWGEGQIRLLLGAIEWRGS